MMSSQQSFRLSKKTVIAALITAAFPAMAWGAAGRVEFTVGAVTAVGVDGRERPLSKGAEINAGDTLQTADGRLQARFTDGGYISLQPNTEFKVEDYNFNGKADGSEKGFFSLVKGGLRAITGSIGHTNRQAYRVNTPVATIGIRGTEFLAQFDTRLLVKVGDGAVYLSNATGDIILYKGQVGEVGSVGSKPKQSNDTPTISAAGPSGGTPDKTKDQQDSQQQNQTIFTVGSIRNGTEDLCQVSSTCFSQLPDTFQQVNALLQGPLSNLPQLAALGAGAVYTGSSNISLSFAPDSATLTESLLVDFSNYSATFSISSSTFVGTGSLNGTTLTGAASGSLNSSTGVFGFSPGTTVLLSGTNVYSGSLNVTTASLNSSNISQATMAYSVSEGLTSSSTSVNAHTLSGFAFPLSAP